MAMAVASFGLSLASPARPSAAAAVFKSSPATPSAAVSGGKSPKPRVRVQASLKEKVVTGLTAAALTAAVMMPEVAEAAAATTAPGVLTPSLKNFLFSIIAGGVVLTAIAGAVVGVSNFDPVKRT